MMKLSSDNGSITSRRAAAHRLPVPYRAPNGLPLAQVERDGGEEGETGIVAPYTYHGDCLCWLMATYAAHTSHYEAILGASRAPLLSPWPGHRRVMANALRIKCIFSLTARWHRYLDARQYRDYAILPRSSLPLSLLVLRFGWVLPRFSPIVVANFDCHFLRMREDFVIRRCN